MEEKGCERGGVWGRPGGGLVYFCFYKKKKQKKKNSSNHKFLTVLTEVADMILHKKSAVQMLCCSKIYRH